MKRQIASDVVTLERVQWVIQEVERRSPEFQALPLGHLERLEYRQITIEIGGAVNVRELVPAVGSRRRHSKAVHIDVLVSMQIRCGIANYRRLKLNLSSTEPGVVRYTAAVQTRRIIRVSEVVTAEPQIKVATIRLLQVGAALPSCYTGEIPAIRDRS